MRVRVMSERKKLTRALVSVYNKDGVIELGRALVAADVEILATGSTAKVLSDAGISVTAVESYTGFPEMLDGRVKTLHPRIHAGLLADQNKPSHLAELTAADIKPFDLLVINLYPFTETIASGADFNQCLAEIDIGGPSMLRGAAKNHGSVAVISDPSQYQMVEKALVDGGFTYKERKELALATFRKTAEYDLAIATWLAEDSQWHGQIWNKLSELRYGENPHQDARVYRDNSGEGIASAQQIQGKEMSFNNYIDADAALRTAYDHDQPCVAIIKHTNPSGIALGENIESAYAKAYASDPVSAFGGVIASNRIVTPAMAEQVLLVFTEVIIAPGFDPGALEMLRKKPSIRILQLSHYQRSAQELRTISGGLLIQQPDLIDADGDSSINWRQVSGAKVSDAQMRDLEFAWRCVRSVKSNAILLAADGASIGIGMGQINRVDSARLAVSRAGDRVKASVGASDAFFPFADGVQILINAGVTAIVQPGGSVRDEEVIAAAKAGNIAMFFTGVRHFAHT